MRAPLLPLHWEGRGGGGVQSSPASSPGYGVMVSRPDCSLRWCGRYVRTACTELTFFEPTTVQTTNVRQPSGLQMCADPATEVAAAGCCPPGHDPDDSGRADCKYTNEVMSYSKAVERCAARSDGYTEVCPARWDVPGCFPAKDGGTLALDERSWLAVANTSCEIKAQVMSNGR